MSTITNEELGRRRFQVLRDKAAELGLEKIRKSIGDLGEELSPNESSLIREVLKEIWSGVDNNVWESFSFTRLTHDDIRAILTVAKSGKNQKDAVPAMAEIMKKILLEKLC